MNLVRILKDLKGTHNKFKEQRDELKVKREAVEKRIEVRLSAYCSPCICSDGVCVLKRK